ncbi:MAG TPA: hypothetical protein VK158_00210 [Acidobacteriota bacterium]|nr:hypothetical protein [Acidobacteriota bacterium]
MAKKVEKTQKAISHHFYVGVLTPQQIQRSVLEGSKGLLTVLARYERLKQVRENKMRQLEKFHLQMTAIRTITGKLTRAMPKYDLEVQAPFLAEPQPVVIDTPVQKEPEKKIEKKVVLAPQTELEKLEAELAAIEGKLSSM